MAEVDHWEKRVGLNLHFELKCPCSPQSAASPRSPEACISAAAANNKLLLSSNQITTVTNGSVEVVNTFYDNIHYMPVLVADVPISCVFDFFDPIADHIHSVEMKKGHTLLHCAAGMSHSAARVLPTS
ncbi:Dual specificity protein phosphatase 18 [Fukomys damarensis]|uniref:Dual specificity protein phosphatase 18 n=1 Tax=Fukomys damarensis TaxID=885580 RepID=A0A091CY91_FUKDA|nr:Dual specificity protein phosphatase 18 [Fukomys damarensis]